MDNFNILQQEHIENTELQSKMDFYKDEIRILKNRLTDLSKELEKEKDLKELEQLQNQLDIQENNANNISHAIRNNEKGIDKAFVKIMDEKLSLRNDQHQKELDLVTTFEKNLKEVRKAVKNLSIR